MRGGAGGKAGGQKVQGSLERWLGQGGSREEGSSGRVCCPVRLDACVSVASQLRRPLLSRLGVGAGACRWPAVSGC